MSDVNNTASSMTNKNTHSPLPPASVGQERKPEVYSAQSTIRSSMIYKQTRPELLTVARNNKRYNSNQSVDQSVVWLR